MPRHHTIPSGALGFLDLVHAKPKEAESTGTDSEAKSRHDLLSIESKATRLAPRQFLSPKWPQLQYGAVPKVEIADFKFELRVESKVVARFDYEEILTEWPRYTLSSVDFHCVTGWSILDASFEGIPVLELFQLSGLDPSRYARVFSHCLDGFTGSLQTSRVEKAWLVTHAYGQPLEPKHGFPLRLLVPSLYGFKSAKWVTALELTKEDKLGFWEIRGYDDSADPWLEERFAGATGQDGLTAAQRAKHALKKGK